MTAETLRKIIIDKERPKCITEPTAHSIADYLGCFWWHIMDENAPDKMCQKVLQSLGYTDLLQLRIDYILLIQQLQHELETQDFASYFRIYHEGNWESATFNLQGLRKS